jgi:hypothetical protein
MDLSLQILSIFFSFIYGMFIYFSLNLYKKIKISQKINIIFQIIFCFTHVILFYLLLYKLNFGILNYYEFIFILLGIIFCKEFYYTTKKD